MPAVKTARPGDPAYITQSHGVFTSSSAVDAVTKENCAKLMFTTNNHIHLFPKTSTETERGENLLTVYEKNRKIKQFRPREAPLHHRDSGVYSKEFCNKEAIDYHANKQFLAMQKPIHQDKIPDKNEKLTLNQETYRQRTLDELRQAKQPTQHPYLTLFKAGQPMIVKRAHSQEQFEEWPVRLLDSQRPGSALHTKSQDHEQGQMGELSSKTMYNFYTGPKQKKGPPTLSSSQGLPRGASVSALGGTNVRLKYMSAHQNDYLVATRSFSRGGASKSEASFWGSV